MADKKLNTFIAVVYSTGQGMNPPARMPLLLQPLSGQPVIQYVIDSARDATGNPPFLMLDQRIELPPGEVDSGALIIPQGEGADNIEAILKSEPDLQDSAAHLLIIPANLPLLTTATLEKLIHHHAAVDSSSNHPPALTVAAIKAHDARQLNQFPRNNETEISGIPTAEKSTADLDKEAEYDTGIYCLSSSLFRDLLSNKPGSPPGANPFSWLVQSAYSADIPVQAFDINPQEALSIDSQAAFSTAGSIMRTRINQDLMHSGVAIIDPATTYIDAQVSIGQETVIQPNTYLRGRTSIGRGCQIGPNAMITDTVVGDRCEITFSVAESAVLEDDVDIGPFAHLRKGAHLARGVHMGNYGEVKNSYLGPGTKMGHFSYVGDADIGPGVNIGAGVITANYDGQSKHPTEIGAGAFIGSDTMLIAPVKIGAGARTGAGSVVTKDVPPNSLAVGIPARIIRKEEDQDGP